MGVPDSPSKSPTRIPRPTFVASTPRTPSIRAVPYNPSDRAVNNSCVSGKYSPSNWPFPKSSKDSSIELSNLAGMRNDTRSGNFDTMNSNPDTQAGPSTAASGTNRLSVDDSRGRAARDSVLSDYGQSDTSFCSVETQIYAPLDRNSSASAARPRSNSAIDGSFGDPAPDVPDRPVTPNPYSIVRKVSEASQSANDDDDKVNRQEDEALSPGRGSKRLLFGRQQGSVIHDHKTGSTSVVQSTGGYNPNHITPVSRGEPSSSLGLSPIFEASVTDSVSRRVQDTGNNAEHSGHSRGDDADTPAANRNVLSLVLMRPSEEMEARHSHSLRLPNDETLRDLESLRRGPRLRHNRLAPSPSMVANNEWQIPKVTRELWGIADRSWNMIMAFVVLFVLSVLSFVASFTVLIMSVVEHADAATGMVVATVVSSTLSLVFGVLLWIGIVHHRKMTKNLISGETWVEMTHRARPLPARPEVDQVKQDKAATQAWEKFSQDQEQLRNYVEYLEGRVGILEEDKAKLEEAKSNDTPQGNDGLSASAAPSATASATAGAVVGPTVGPTADATTGANAIATTSNAAIDEDDGGSTPRARRPSVGCSSSRRELLREDTASESGTWGNATIPRSDTNASILTELCAAVTEYSLLSEVPPMPPMPQLAHGFGHVAHSSNNDTPSNRPRASRYLALPDKAVIPKRGQR